MSAQDLLRRAQADGLLAPGRPVVVMLSGGRDSTCLLDLAVRIVGGDAVSSLHVNYGLRAVAVEDERHCAELSERLGVALEVRRPSRPHKSGNLQAWAREERYAAASALASSRGADVAAGHTATDQVETILYRLASSPSRRALLGMRAREGRLVRPLLTFTRDETAAREDSPGARTRRTSPTCTRAGACARNWCRRSGPSIPARWKTCWRSRRSSATKLPCSTPSSMRSSARGRTSSSSG